MNVLDRYVLRIFLNTFFVCFFAFLCLFVIIDSALHSTRFFALKGYTLIPFFFEYYVIRLPVFTQYTLPSVTMVAAVYTFVHLSRKNEIIPIVASGRSLRRTATPLLAFAVFVGLCMAMIDEYLLPRLSERLGQTYSVLRTRGAHGGNIQLYGTNGTLLEARQYNYQDESLAGLRFTEIGENGRRKKLLVAEKGNWDSEKQGWILLKGEVYPFDDKGDNLLTTTESGLSVQRRDPLPPLYQCEITEEDLHRRNKFFGEFVSLSEVRQRVRDFPEIPDMKIQLYSRFAFPWTPLVLLLLGLPTIPVTSRFNIFRGLITSFAIALGFYATYFILLDLGGFGNLPPLLASFGATASFGAYGLWSFLRERM